MKKLLDKVRDLVVTPCLEEGESYSAHARKMLVIAVTIIASNALLLGVPVTVLDALYEPTVGSYILGGMYVQVTITAAIFPYLYMRTTHTLPEWVSDMQLWSTVPITLALSLFIHQGSVTVICAVVCCMSIVMRVRGWPVLLIYFIGISILHALINDYAEELPALHDAFYHTQILPTKSLYLIGANVTPLLCFGVGLFIIMSDFSQRMDQADAAIAMNLAVADKLRRYDTDGVAEILAANQGKVDEKLLEAFAAIQHNLQEYRPHIPDYVIEATIADLMTSDDDPFNRSTNLLHLDNVDDEEGDFSFKMSESNYSASRSKSFFGHSSTSGVHPHNQSVGENSSAQSGNDQHADVMGSPPRCDDTCVK